MARFYAACLASYNSGILHGAWIDASADSDEMQDGINEMLRASPCPNVTVEDPETGQQVPSAEEWAIHDYEGFPSTFGEYEGLAKIAEWVELAEYAEDQHNLEPGDLAAIHAGLNGTVSNTKEELETNFRGVYDSFKDYAEEVADETIQNYTSHSEIPQFFSNYFDYDAFAHDLKMETSTFDLANYRVAVFAA